MALHFLPDHFTAPDREPPHDRHELELFEQTGQRYLRLWVGGIGKNQPVCMSLTKAQALSLAAAAEALAHRIIE